MCSDLHISMIPILFWSFTLPFFVAFCVNSKKKSKASSQDILKARQSASPIESNYGGSSESVSVVVSERNTKSPRTSTTDSLKVPRLHSMEMSSSAKSSKMSFSSKSSIGTETDSPKTELIEVPLGKAAVDCPTSSILTPAEERKSSPFAPPTRKVTFASKLLTRVKRRGVKPESSDDEKTSFIP